MPSEFSIAGGTHEPASVAALFRQKNTETEAYKALAPYREKRGKATQQAIEAASAFARPDSYSFIRALDPDAAALIKHSNLLQVKSTAANAHFRVATKLAGLKADLVRADHRLGILRIAHGITAPEGLKLSVVPDQHSNDITHAAHYEKLHSDLTTLREAFAAKGDASVLRQFDSDAADIMRLQRAIPSLKVEEALAKTNHQVIQKLAWGTRSKAQALMASMFSKSTREGLRNSVVPSALVLALSLPPLIAIGVQQSQRSASRKTAAATS